jgi:mannose-6-phosphate isomerase-like protein (cupin superfamily)
MPDPVTPGVEFAAPRGLAARFVRTTVADGVMEIEWRVPVGQRLVAIPHKHPDGPEDWRVVSGTARYRLGLRSLTARAPDGWTVPGNTTHVHPANVGDEPLVVRQIIAPDPPMPELTAGVERYFETVFALAQQGKVDRFGRIRDPLQDMLAIWENLVPGSYIAWIPIPVQRAVLRNAADLAKKRGRRGWIEAERAMSVRA